MSRHVCHAEGCETPVPPRMLMCARHWRMVPRAMQDAVWATYSRGQEADWSKVTPEYLDAATAAVRAVAEREGARDE